MKTKVKETMSQKLMKSIRIPVAPPTSCHSPKGFNRKVKHKKEISHE